MINYKKSLVASIALFALVGCGGGSGDSSSNAKNTDTNIGGGV